MDIANCLLLTDLYQLNMIRAYFAHGKTKTAVFEFFIRKMPDRRNFFVAAGLEQVIEFLENLRFSPDDIAWLKESRRFERKFLDELSRLRFTGDVHAMPEGTIFFPNEPILRITAPLPEAQLIETRLINILHFQSLIATKSARMALHASDKMLVDFGLRRAHGAEAGLMAARASFIGGFTGTATVLANKMFGIPIYGTMAHSFVQSFDAEIAAFEAFALSQPENLILLIDTYDTEVGAKKVVSLAQKLKRKGISIQGVRLDSGDLIALSKSVRVILDEGGLKDAAIFASGNIDEEKLTLATRERAPIDGFGIGTNLTTSFDVPALDCAYKLQEYGGVARRKRSTGKMTWPGRKQVWRNYRADGRMTSDTLSTEDDHVEGEPLIRCVMRNGERTVAQPTLTESRDHLAHGLKRLPEHLKSLESTEPYPVHIGDKLAQLAGEVDRRIIQRERLG